MIGKAIFLHREGDFLKLISIVVPVYNEEVKIRHFYEAIRTVMEPLP